MEPDNPFEHTRRIPPRGQQEPQGQGQPWAEDPTPTTRLARGQRDAVPSPGWPPHEQEQSGQPVWPTSQQQAWPAAQQDQRTQQDQFAHQGYAQESPVQQGFAPPGWAPPQKPFGAPQNSGYQYRQSSSTTGSFGAVGAVGAMGAQPMAATATADTVDEPGRRDVMKILRNVGIVCSALVGVVKVADMLGAFNSLKNPNKPSASLIGGLSGSSDNSGSSSGATTAAGDQLPAAGKYDSLPRKKLIGAGFKVDATFDQPAFSLDGTSVYLVTSNGELIAYDVVKGSQRWSKTIAGENGNTVGTQTPAVGKVGGAEMVFVAAQDGVVAVRASDGSIARRLSPPDGLQPGVIPAALGWDGSNVLWFLETGDASSQYALAKVDPASGTLKKRLNTSGIPADMLAGFSPTYGNGRATVLGANTAPWLVLVDTTNGNVRKASLGDGMATLSVTGDASQVYLASKSLAGLEAKDITHANWKWVPTDGTADTNEVSGQIANDETYVYAVSWSSVLYALDKVHGVPKQSMKVQTGYEYLTVANQTLYAGDLSAGGLVAIDPLKMKEKWWCPFLPAGTKGQLIYPVLVNDKVAVATIDQEATGDTPEQHLLYVVDIVH